MRRNNYFIRLQCTLVLGDYDAYPVIGINSKHESRMKVTFLHFNTIHRMTHQYCGHIVVNKHQNLQMCAHACTHTHIHTHTYSLTYILLLTMSANYASDIMYCSIHVSILQYLSVVVMIRSKQQFLDQRANSLSDISSTNLL